MESAPPTSAKSGDLGGRRVLFIAYYFPPTMTNGLPGSMRTIKFLRNLTNGEYHVLTHNVNVSDTENALAHLSLPVNGEFIHRVAPWDIFKPLLAFKQAISALVQTMAMPDKHRGKATKPAQVSRLKASFAKPDQGSRFQRLKDLIYNLCYFPDQAGPWIVPAALAGQKLVREHQLDVIFATGSPWSGLITGWIISKSTGIPLIVDFRDPWINNPFNASKGQFLDSCSYKLERAVVKHASSVSLNTTRLQKTFFKRYPEVEQKRFFVMPNGYDLFDFNQPPAPVTFGKNRIFLDLYHAGTLYGVRDPAPLLDAVRQINRAVSLEDKQDKLLRVIQIGALHLAYDIQERYKDLLETGALILKPAKSYKECLLDLASADAVVNIQPFTENQIPSKLYDYLALNKPMISITPDNGALSELVRQKQLGLCADPSRPDEVVSVLCEFRREHGTSFTGYANRREFDVAAIAAKLAEKIRTLSSAETQQ